MAVDVQRSFPLHQARARRHELSRYLKLDGGRYLLGMTALLCLMSMIALGQTGVVATKGYAIANLEQQHTHLMREHSQLQLRLAAAQSLDTIRARAEELGLRPLTNEQARYITIEQVPPASAGGEQPAGSEAPATTGR